ncbi:protein translocase subunit SecD [Patescibacteria group bacterium]
MTQQSKIRVILLIIFLLTAAAVYVDYPKSPDLKIGNWEKELKVHLGLDLEGGIHLVYRADVNEIPDSDRSDALDGARDVIERRINIFGVSEPIVQTSQLAGDYRIIVELAGVFDVNRAIEIIGDTPLLEFKEEGETSETDELSEVDADITAYNEQAKNRAQEILTKALSADADFASLANEFSEDPGNTNSEGDKLGGELGFNIAGTFVEEFDEALFVNLEDDEIYPELVETVFGYHIIKREESRQNDDDELEVKSRHILISKRSEQDIVNQLENYQATDLTGQHLKSAQVQFDPNTNEPLVALEFNSEGSDLFAEITKRNLGRTVAIFLDGAPISIPVVNQEITSGQAVIQGSFTLDDAKTLARRLNAGALPVPLTLLSQQSIGATLGRQSVETSLFAGLVGLIMVAIFMVIYYRLPGVMAVLALTIYALIVLAIFKLWPVTLTLAGVAGFILSIGMAVDANILIFERLKEELRAGRAPAQAVEEAFRRAWPSIRDANISSLITTFILFIFSTSLIRGFAVTLSIGIVISMFSAMVITKNLLRSISVNKDIHGKKIFGIKIPTNNE